MIYLGTLGRMIGIKCPASQQVAVEDLTTFKSTLEGRRLAQVPPAAGRRAWQCQLSDASTPDQVGAVMAFINREWGNEPFVYVSADAPVTNMLTPAAASCDPAEAVLGSGTVVAAHPPMLTPDGWAGRSYMKNAVNSLFFGRNRVPLPDSGKVTASAYVLGAGGAVQVSWYDAAGGSLGTTVSTVKSTAATVVRSYVTATPPAGATAALVSVNAPTVQISHPALTWSDTLLPWADGQGCAKAIIHGASRDLVMASRDSRGGRYSNLSFTVTEVG